MGSTAETKKFYKWRKRAAAKLPEVSNKVFSLRGQFYTGCGTHWSLEKSLGFCINNIMNYDSQLEYYTQIIVQITFEELIKDLKRIEKELTPCG